MILTGDVMKESAHIAYTHAKSCLMRKQPGNKFFDVSMEAVVLSTKRQNRAVTHDAEGFSFSLS